MEAAISSAADSREAPVSVNMTPSGMDLQVKMISAEDARRLGDMVRDRYREAFDLLKDK